MKKQTTIFYFSLVFISLFKIIICLSLVIESQAKSQCVECGHNCLACHSSEESVKQHVVLLGNTYCPQCKIKGDKDWQRCPKCGGLLIDLDKLMKQSSLNPHHEICRKCHLGNLQDEHAGFEEFNSERDCLECHISEENQSEK